MKTSDFDYHLPEQLIAQTPPKERGQSRLLTVNGKDGALHHLTFSQLPQCLKAGDLLVINDTRVIPARLYGEKSTGGKVELLLERVLGEQRGLVHIKASKAPKPGTQLFVAGVEATVVAREDDLFIVDFATESLDEFLEKAGSIPLPPYITRAAEAEDQERYQTIYNQYPGSVAAPTAGLHFTSEMLQQLQKAGIELGKLTLHVGAGTFQPVRVESLHAHKMHGERVSVSAELCQQIQKTKAQGGRVIAVGTTCVRSLETAAEAGDIQPFSGESRLFIYPGFRFHCVDAMITNFHLPKSTLFMLVCAFAGVQTMRHAYQVAIEEKYRFFSYGDAMLITRGNCEI